VWEYFANLSGKSERLMLDGFQALVIVSALQNHP
jgi:hypothetical protein